MQGDPGDACSWSTVQVPALEVLPSGSMVAGGRLNRRCGSGGFLPLPILRVYRPDGTRDTSVVLPSGLDTISRLAALPDGGLGKPLAQPVQHARDAVRE